MHILYFAKSYSGSKQRVEKKDIYDSSSKKLRRLSYFFLKISTYHGLKTHAGQKIVLSQLLQITNITGKFS